MLTFSCIAQQGESLGTNSCPFFPGAYRVKYAEKETDKKRLGIRLEVFECLKLTLQLVLKQG